MFWEECVMLFVHWDFKGDSVLGRCIVERDIEPYESDSMRAKENVVFERLAVASTSYNAIAEKLEHDGFPDLCPPNWKTDDDYPLWQLADQKNIGIRDIPCNEILGFNWANTPKHLIDGHYPKEHKVRLILAGYLNLNDDGEDTASKMEPIDAYHVMGTYFIGEGNHRLYVSRLLNRPTIRANVFEVDYEGLLRKSIPYRQDNWLNIGIEKPGSESYLLHDVSKKAFQRYLELRELFVR